MENNDTTHEESTKSRDRISKWWRKYRVMPDTYAGFQAEVWTIWFPFWRQIGFTNTFRTREAAEKYARGHANSDLL